MKDNKKATSRRAFLSLNKSKIRKEAEANFQNKSQHEQHPGKDKIKMLTPDGRLVEIDKTIVESGHKKKASNHDIMNWSENKSFEKS